MTTLTKGGTIATIAVLTAAATLATMPVRPAAAAPDRSPDAILADYARAVGGDAAWSKHKTVHAVTRLTVKGMGLSGTEDRWATSTGQFLSVTTIPGIPAFRGGTDGRVSWTEDPINGLRVLDAKEAEQARVDMTWNADLKLKKLFTKIALIPAPADAPAGSDLECLEMSARLSPPLIMCFDAKTHLRAFDKGSKSTPQGETPFTSVITAWRDMGSVKVPAGLEMVAGPMTLQGQLESIAFDQKPARGLFRLPAKVAEAAAKGRPSASKTAAK